VGLGESVFSGEATESTAVLAGLACGAADVAAEGVEEILHVGALERFDGAALADLKCIGGQFGLCVGLTRLGVLTAKREVTGKNFSAGGAENSAVDGVVELSNVAWP